MILPETSTPTLIGLAELEGQVREHFLVLLAYEDILLKRTRQRLAYWQRLPSLSNFKVIHKVVKYTKPIIVQFYVIQVNISITMFSFVLKLFPR